MTKRNIAALVLIIFSLGLLYPGLTNDILTLNIGAKIPMLGDFELYNESQSILKTVRTLHENDSTLVAALILLFSVIVPVLKAIALLAVLLIKNLKSNAGLYRFVGLIGKWSMADVFVVGVFLAFLATKNNEAINAELEVGFYYFTAYCIVSIIGIQVLDIKAIKNRKLY
jgi:uncharacterized paraquat-inducible protein A